MIPGMAPLSNEPSNFQSTEPSHQCPAPAISVSGTAWAMSEPTMLTIGSSGYSSTSAVTPIAPAPTEEMLTTTPNTAPQPTVSHSLVCGVMRCIAGPTKAKNQRRASRTPPVSTSTMPRENEITLPMSGDSTLNCDSTSTVTIVAGTLPLASRPTTRQSTVRFAPCTSVPTLLLAAAYSRSVPTAVAGWKPNSSTSNGVINDPPPTPV